MVSEIIVELEKELSAAFENGRAGDERSIFACAELADRLLWLGSKSELLKEVSDWLALNSVPLENL